MVNSRNGTQIGPVDGHVMLRIIDGLSEYGDTTAPLSFRCIEDSRGEYTLYHHLGQYHSYIVSD